MKTVATHSGKFHADDVFAVATLQLVFGVEELEIIRTRDEDKIQSADIVLDVGMEHDPERQRFDHHQPGGAGERENGIQYASFGLVWNEYGRQLTGSDEVWSVIDEKLVQQIDANDNGIEVCESRIEGVFPYTVGAVVNSFRPSWKKESDYYAEFTEAVAFARGLLQREIAYATDVAEAKERVLEAYARSEDKRLIIFEKTDAFGREIVANALIDLEEPLFAVLYRPDVDSWQLATIPVARGTFEKRKSLPESWAGLRDEELDEATGVEGGIFCHRARFMLVAKTEEAILELARKALEADK